MWFTQLVFIRWSASKRRNLLVKFLTYLKLRIFYYNNLPPNLLTSILSINTTFSEESFKLKSINSYQVWLLKFLTKSLVQFHWTTVNILLNSKAKSCQSFMLNWSRTLKPKKTKAWSVRLLNNLFKTTLKNYSKQLKYFRIKEP